MLQPKLCEISIAFLRRSKSAPKSSVVVLRSFECSLGFSSVVLSLEFLTLSLKLAE